MSLTDDSRALPPLVVPQSSRPRTVLGTAEEILGGLTRRPAPRDLTIGAACAADATHPDVVAHRALRRAVFVQEQGLFGGRGDDLDDTDSDPRAVVLLARDADGTPLGGVRLGPARPGEPDVGWWTGSRLAVTVGGRRRAGVRVGAALVRAAVARAEAAGVLRFEADVQAVNGPLFTRLGWETVREVAVPGAPDVPHLRMRHPMDRIQRLVDATKSPLGELVAGLGPAGFIGDDGAPVPGSDVVAACDAILPAMVERDPEWAGWCGVLVNVNDLAAMGARPVGLLDAVGARDASFAARVLRGLRAAADAYGVPVLGGHTTVDVPASLAVTALGTTPTPVPAGGGRVGHAVRLSADLDGAWRPGYTGRQFDTTSRRRPEELRAMVHAIGPGGAPPARGGQGREHGGPRRDPRDARRGQRHRRRPRRRGRAPPRRRGRRRLVHLLPRLRAAHHRRARRAAPGRRSRDRGGLRRAHRHARRAPALARRGDDDRRRRPRDRAGPAGRAPRVLPHLPATAPERTT